MTPQARVAGSRLTLTALTGLVLALLLAANLAQHVLGWDTLWLGPVSAALLLAVARAGGLSWAELGLARDRLAPGARWAGAAIGVVALVYTVGVLVPTTRTFFLDSRYHLGVGEVLLEAFVVFPLATVVPEEILFRSVLWGVLARRLSATWVLVTTAGLFGLWHVLPALDLAGTNQAIGEAAEGHEAVAQWAIVVGTVLLTAVGGLVFGWLRQRSDSVLASIGMHWATNALGILFGLAAWRLAG